MEWTEVVIALAGILGTFGGTFAGIRAERVRWEQEQRTRFHPDRYAKYTQLLRDADKLIRTPFDTPEEERLLEAMNEAYAHILMLSSKPVKEAAEEFYKRSFNARFGELDGSGVAPVDARTQYIYPARDAFIEAARKGLGITAESLA